VTRRISPPLNQTERDAGDRDYTKRRNLNRGYMKLEAWQRGMDLFVEAFRLSTKLTDFKLRSRFRDAAQSVSANIAEGYGRRSLPEYLPFLYTAKGSLAETWTRAIGIQAVAVISPGAFEQFDLLHYEVENNLLHLIESLEHKRDGEDWSDSIPPGNPRIHQSHRPSIHPFLDPSNHSSLHPPIRQPKGPASPAV